MTIQNLFEIFDLETIYPQFHEQLEQLAALHKSANMHGNMLLISFTPEQLKKCVYVAEPGGSKAMIKVYGEKTDDVTTIVDALKQHASALENSDEIEYCMTLTQDCALDPQNGPRIFSFNTADSEIMQQYATVRDNIFAELKKQPLPKTSTISRYAKDIKKMKKNVQQFFAGSLKTLKDKRLKEWLQAGTQIILASSIVAGFGNIVTGDITPTTFKETTWWKALACSVAWYGITERVHAPHSLSQNPYILSATLTLAPCGLYRIFKKFGW